MRGRKPKPTTQRELEGNPGRRPLNNREPKPPVSDAFDVPPAELDGDKRARARAEWSRLAPMLRASRQVTDADHTALLAVCLEWARYLDAMKQVDDKGLIIAAPSGYPIMNPYLHIATKALSSCMKLWPELGLTPSSRSRLQTNGDGPGPGGDPFSEFDENDDELQSKDVH